MFPEKSSSEDEALLSTEDEDEAPQKPRQANRKRVLSTSEEDEKDGNSIGR